MKKQFYYPSLKGHVQIACRDNGTGYQEVLQTLI